MRNRFLRSTSVRLSLRYALLYSILAALIFAFSFFFLRAELRDWIEDDLASVRAELATVYESGGRGALLNDIERRVTPNDENLMLYQVRDRDGRWLGGNVRGIDPATKPRSVAADEVEMIGDFDDEVSSFQAQVIDFPDAIVVIGKSRQLYREVLNVLASVLAVSLVPLFLIGIAFGTLVGRGTEARINAIRQTLSEVASGDLNKRIADKDRDDDIGRVVQAANATLGRLEALVESQQQISSDIAHDLKTPIQRLRQKLERLRDDSSRSEEIEGCIAETDTIIDTFQALLRIAQIDAGARRERFRAVDLNEVCGTVTDVFGAAAEEAGFLLEARLSTDPIVVDGDRELLTQLVSNLVDNALRHCQSGTTIKIETESFDGAPALAVIDDGPGIPVEEREKVFRRLYRLDKSRTTGGNGLGLSTVKAIADLHGAAVILSDNGPGLTATIRFGKHSPDRPAGKLY